jgi:hypothetical protein
MLIISIVNIFSFVAESWHSGILENRNSAKSRSPESKFEYIKNSCKFLQKETLDCCSKEANN